MLHGVIVPVMTVQEQVLNNQELTAIILQYLKNITLKELCRDGQEEEQIPKFPASWTALFARLSTVNRAFFHGSIEVLWEHLDSPIPPFHNILPADRDENGRLTYHVSYCQHKLTARHWDRFLFYASKVKSLVLRHDNLAPAKSATPVMSATWLYIAMGSEGRPTVLFPCLRHISLVATDSLSLYIAYNSIASLQSFKVDFTSEASDSTTRDHARALTTGLTQSAVRLTDLRMEGVMSVTMVGTIAQIKTLSSLRLSIGYDMGSAEAIPRVPGPDLYINNIISKGTVFRTLTNLSVRASGLTQYYIAGALLPCNLTALKITMIPDATNGQLALLPPVLAIYASRNPSLVSVSANCDVAHPGFPTTIEPSLFRNLQRNPHYTNLEILLDGIAALRCLQVLEIVNSPFIAVDFVPKLLAVIPRLPLLRVLKLSATRATDNAMHGPALPPLEALEAFPQHNPHLTLVELNVDSPADFPELPAQAIRHGLRFLSLGLPADDYANYGSEDKFKLARYLGRLFPQVEMVSRGMNPEEREFWGFMNQLMSFSRACRADLLDELERSRSS